MDTSVEPITLPEFVRLLQRAHGPAVERLTADDPPWVAMAYIDDKIACLVDDEVRTTGSARGAARRQWLALNEHRRSRALLTGLALSFGADPGPLALGVTLTPTIGSTAARTGWRIATADMEVAIVPTAYMVPERREVGVPHLAAVPAHDPMLFLTLATRWRIALTEVPRG